LSDLWIAIVADVAIAKWNGLDDESWRETEVSNQQTASGVTAGTFWNSLF